MSLRLERYAKQAVLLERKGDFSPVASSAILDDVLELARLHRMTWERRQRELSGHIVAMPEGAYGALLAYPTAQTVTTSTLSGTVNLWSNLVYTPIPQNGILAPQAYRIIVAGKNTTSTSPANIGFDPRIASVGTWTTGGTATSGGSSLGASTNVALTASITNAFYYIIGDLTLRVGGTSSTIVAMFHYVSTQATSSGLAGPAATGAGHNLLFGGTAVTVDTQTTAQSFQLGAVHTVTTITHNIEQIHMMDWN